MLFNSFEFVGFFIVFLIVFFSAPQGWRGVILLASSYIFYMGWRPSFALLLAFTTVVDYSTGLVMGSAHRQGVRKAAMLTALTINLGILGAVKYLDFIITNVVGVGGYFGFAIPQVDLGIVLPVGISFYTFQSVGYTLDVYFRRIPVERSFLIYAQYVSFFPQLVAGPIERAGHMLKQYKAAHYLVPERVSSGLWLVGYGLFLKMCIADMVAPYVKAVFASPSSFNGSYSALALLLFALQIYCDFCGYSTIARGVARIMGYDLMINFAQPYYSTSLTEFWRRWHISLSTWFRDFVYFPLGGNRVTEIRRTVNLMIVFTVSGIWHGAAWTFVIWGALHGAGLVFERFVGDHLPALGRLTARSGRFGALLGWGWTMGLVLIGWAFFRAASIGDALTLVGNLAHPGRINYGTFKVAGIASFEIVLLALFIPAMFVTDFLIMKRPEALLYLYGQRWVNVVGGVALMYVILMFGVFGHVDFIYFQF